MGKNRYINTRFWSDSWIVDDLNPLDRYVLLYLLTNEKTSLSGIYELPMRTIANETGLDKEELARMIDRLKPKVYYQNGWVVLVNAIKHQNYRNGKIKSAIQRELQNAHPDLVALLHIPSDFTADLSMTDDESSMSHTRDMHGESHLIKLNLIKSNSTARPALASSTRAAGSKIDQELAAKEKAARRRKPTGQGTSKISEIFAGGK